MLTHLHIKNFTIVAELNIDFHSGMTVLTGETGSGKSIIIDTLELALGARADNSSIRQGADHCEISATFDITNLEQAKKWLDEEALNSDNECIIRRTITNDGRSRSTINGKPCTQQQIRYFSNLLLNIHGQHEHQTLLKHDKQRQLLDKYANHNDLLAEVKQLYDTCHTIDKELRLLKQLTQNQNSQQEFLNYQLQELEALNIQENEIENLHQEHKQLTNAEQIMQNCHFAFDILQNSKLSLATSKLTGISTIDNKIIPIIELINSAAIQSEEAETELNHYINNANLNPERLFEVEQRLNHIHDIARKHKVKPEELFQLQVQLLEQLQQLTNAENRHNELTEKNTQLIIQYQKAAQKLTVSRQHAANKLAEKIEQQLQNLNMHKCKFSINLITEAKFSAYGNEQVEFCVITNPGQPPKPLNKIVSGGELSRISLAIQVITATKNTMPTFIFDEVDVGIGGKTAQIVGQLLRSLGEKAQILCVTHLPQVAAQGHHHLQVHKEITETTVAAQINKLSTKERVEEIARMLGGLTITEQTLAHAKEIIENTAK